MNRLLVIIISSIFCLQAENAHPFSIIIKNETAQAIDVTLEGRLDHYYTHSSQTRSSLIPHDEVFMVEQQLEPGKTKEMIIQPTFTSTDHASHATQLKQQSYEPSHHTLRGTLTVQNPNTHYNLEENLQAQDLTLTVTRDGLTVETNSQQS